MKPIRHLAIFLFCCGVPSALIADGEAGSAWAINVEEEVSLDRQLGILDRPWKINLVRIATRDYLRTNAQVRTGIPPYDQQILYPEQLSAAVLDDPVDSPSGSKPKTSLPKPPPLTAPPEPAPPPSPPAVDPSPPIPKPPLPVDPPVEPPPPPWIGG